MSLLKRAFKAKKNGDFLLAISFFLPEIFKILLICKLGTDDIAGCICESQDTKSSISLGRMKQGNGTLYGHLTPYNTQHGA